MLNVNIKPLFCFLTVIFFLSIATAESNQSTMAKIIEFQGQLNSFQLAEEQDFSQLKESLAEAHLNYKNVSEALLSAGMITQETVQSIEENCGGTDITQTEKCSKTLVEALGQSPQGNASQGGAANNVFLVGLASTVIYAFEKEAYWAIALLAAVFLY